MAYTIRNSNLPIGEAIFAVDIDIIAWGAQGYGIADGCAVTAQSTPNMTVQVAQGIGVWNGTLTNTVSNASLTIPTADPQYMRIDLISIAAGGGSIICTTGLPELGPSPPVIPATTSSITDIVLAYVYVRPGTTTIRPEDIQDKRLTVTAPKVAAGDNTNSVLPALSAYASGTSLVPSVSLNASRGTLRVPTDLVNGDWSGRMEFSGRTGGAYRIQAILRSLIKDDTTSRCSVFEIETNGGVRLVEEFQASLQTFVGLLVDLTNTASASGTRAFAVAVGGTRVFEIDMTGKLTIGTLDATALTSGTIAAARMPALTGDVTTSAGAVATTIGNDKVTYAQMQNVSAASRLLGRGSSGSGDPQEITLGTNLTMTGTTLDAASGGGTTPYATVNNFTYNTDLNERNLISFTVAAGDLGTTKRLLVYLHGYMICNSGSPTYTLRVKFGTTTLWGEVSPAQGTSALKRPFWLQCSMANLGATNSQGLAGLMMNSAATSGSVAGVGDIAAVNTAMNSAATFGGTATEDSTASRTFAITNQFSISNVAIEMGIYSGLAFLY